jgi:hypothetical protein
MATRMDSHQDKIQDKWFKYIETMILAIDLAVVADQNKENRAAQEYHLMSIRMIDKIISVEGASTEVSDFIKELRERFNGEFVAMWQLPTGLQEKELPEVVFCGVELAIRTEFVTRWKRFRTKDFKQQFPFALDMKSAKKIVRTSLLIGEAVFSLRVKILNAMQDKSMCHDARVKLINQGLAMFSMDGKTPDFYLSELPEIFKIYQSEEQSDEMKEDLEKMSRLVEVVDVTLSQAASGILDVPWGIAGVLYERIGQDFENLTKELSSKSEGIMGLFRHITEELHPLCAESFKEVNVFKVQDPEFPRGKGSRLRYHPKVQERVLRALSFKRVTEIAGSQIPASKTKSKSPFFHAASFLGYFYEFASINYDFCNIYDWVKRLNASDNVAIFLNKSKIENEEELNHYKVTSEMVCQRPNDLILCGKVPEKVKVKDVEKFLRLNFMRQTAVCLRSCEEFLAGQEKKITPEQEKEFQDFVANCSENSNKKWDKVGKGAHPDARDDLYTVLSHFLE